MKSPKLFNLLSLSVCLALPASGWLFTGCAALDPNADPIEVRAEQTISTTFDAMDTFEQIELENQALIKAKAPQVHEFAEWLREPLQQEEGTSMPRGISMINSATLVRRAYKANRTPENKASLASAVAALEQIEHQVQDNITSWSLVTNTATAKPAPAPWDGTSK